MTDISVEKINQCLPQTQCGKCGHPGCRPYAEAIAHNHAPINCCPPGGEMTITALANLLNRPVEPLNETFGKHKPPAVAVIDENACIGCALCLPACPVDAIAGAAKHMHVVIEEQCTGCELCIEPCPVNCIEMVPQTKTSQLSSLEPSSHSPCIHCGKCTEVCPVKINAQMLYHHLHLQDYAEIEAVNQCTECGYCEPICPSHIPLLNYYRFGKQQQADMKQAQQKAQSSRLHYEKKQLRLATEIERKKQLHANQKEQLKRKIKTH